MLRSHFGHSVDWLLNTCFTVFVYRDTDAANVPNQEDERLLKGKCISNRRKIAR